MAAALVCLFLVETDGYIEIPYKVNMF